MKKVLILTGVLLTGTIGTAFYASSNYEIVTATTSEDVTTSNVFGILNSYNVVKKDGESVSDTENYELSNSVEVGKKSEKSKTQEDTTNDFYNMQETVKYDEVLSSDTPTLYYYYQPTCGFCNSVKDQFAEFAKEVDTTDNLDFKLVDMTDSYNNSAWTTDGTTIPVEDMKDVDDIKIVGTPTLIYVKDHKVVQYAIGEEIFDVLDSVEEEYDMSYEFDESVYGHE